MNTREKILVAALDLFSSKGYDPVSVRDISRAVGIKESSLYNHYKNKQDIFDSIISEYSERGTALFRQMQFTGDDGQFAVDDKTIDMYKNMTPDQFATLSSVVFDFYFTDEISVKLRRMLTIEQYRSEPIADLFRDLSFNSAIDYQSGLFAAMIKAGLFIQVDPYILAMEFFSPIFLLFYKFDNREESLREARELFIRHVKQFSTVYSVKA